MSFPAWLLLHHALTILIGVLTFAFAASVLSQRRPTGSAAAWLLLIVLLPYVGIPLYLSFGGRKVRSRAREKKALPLRLAGAPAAAAPELAGVIGWFGDGIAAYHAFLEEITRAKRSIRIQTFLIGDDATGRSIVDALATRAADGVEVHLLLDAFLAAGAPRAQLQKLEARGGRLARFMPLVHVPFRGRANLRNHRKIAVFDGERAFVGGMNLGDEYMGPQANPSRFRDLSLLLQGGTVASLDAVFRADWEFARGESLAAVADDATTSPGIQVVPSGPDCATDPIYDAMLTAAFRAERRFWVATPYFVPDDGLARALEIAARRGVDVRVIVPRRSNHWLADLAAAPLLRDLTAAGGLVQRYVPGMLHAKAVLVDDSFAAVGSANFDMRSLFLDYEISILLSRPADIARLAGWFEETLHSTLPGPPVSGIFRRQAENVSRLLAPLI